MKKILSLIMVLTLMTAGVSMTYADEGQEIITKDKTTAPINQRFLKAQLIEGIIFTSAAVLMIISISASDNSTTASAHLTTSHH